MAFMRLAIRSSRRDGAAAGTKPRDRGDREAGPLHDLHALLRRGRAGRGPVQRCDAFPRSRLERRVEENPPRNRRTLRWCWSPVHGTAHVAALSGLVPLLPSALHFIRSSPRTALEGSKGVLEGPALRESHAGSSDHLGKSRAALMIDAAEWCYAPFLPPSHATRRFP
jgi:hypothetical protein